MHCIIEVLCYQVAYYQGKTVLRSLPLPLENIMLLHVVCIVQESYPHAYTLWNSTVGEVETGKVVWLGEPISYTWYDMTWGDLECVGASFLISRQSYHSRAIEVEREGEDGSGTTSGGVIPLFFLYTPQRFCTVDSGKEKDPKNG